MAVPTQFAYRTLKGVGVVEASPIYDALPGFERPEGNLRCCVYSPCGRYLAYASPETVTVVNASVGLKITSLPAQNVYELGFSPLGTFIITWQMRSKDENGDAVKNLKVWRVVEGGSDSSEEEHNVVGRFVQKSQTGWNLQYTYDERYCARVVTNEVQFYESGDLGTVWNKLRVEGVTDFAVSPGKNHSIAVFVPERKGQPAAVKVFNVPNFDAPVSQKSFFKGDKVQLKWNEEGTSLIVLAQTEVDKSGKSYYGETTLYLLSANGGFDSRIDLDKDGPIHDVTWSPNSKEFGVVYGYMPAKTTIFNTKANATHSFPLSPRNTILFSPHGRFVIVAGFGNLAGQMDIYDMEKSYLKICTIEASNASVCEWSPDGKHILTATTSPRLRVDNGVRIWHVGGGLMYNEDLQELYHVIWRPQSTISHPLENPLNPMPTPHASALKFLGTVKTPSKPAGAYRPPGARGSITPLAFKREDQGGAAYVSDGSMSLGTLGANGFGKPRRRDVPGAETTGENAPGAANANANAADGDENLTKAAAKNKKKREARKAKDAADKATGLAPTADGIAASTAPSPSRSPDRSGRKPHERTRSRDQNDNRPRSRQGKREPLPHKPQPPQPTPTPTTNGASIKAAPPPPIQPPPQPQSTPLPRQQEPPELSVTSPGAGGGPGDKKVRALLKKLRAIDELKMRRAGGEKLEGTQIRKMDTEEEIRTELGGLGWSE